MIAEPIERVVTPNTLRETLNYAFTVAKQVFEGEGGLDVAAKNLAALLEPVSFRVVFDNKEQPVVKELA